MLACEWYEYGRESRAAIEEVIPERERMKQRKGGSGQTSFGPRVKNIIHGNILLYLAITDGFPKVPWTNLSDKDRGIMLKMITNFPHLVRYFQTWNNPALLFSANEPETTTLDMWKKKMQEGRPKFPDNEPIKFGFFSINRKYGRRVLIEEFAKWLTHFEGKAMSETPPIEKELVTPKKPPGRKSIHDTLNALAIMRLRYYCDTFSEAQCKMQALKRKHRGFFYQHRNSANRACDLALRRFQQLYGWLDSEKPIHFTEGWRGGAQK